VTEVLTDGQDFLYERLMAAKEELSAENEETLDKIRAVLAQPIAPAATPVAPGSLVATDHSVILWIYKSLDVLDAKANGLLRFNSVIMAIITLVLNQQLSVAKLGGIGVFLLIVSLSLMAASCFFCFHVIRLDWNILEKAGSKGSYDFKLEINSLIRIVTKRTKNFTSAWTASLAALVLAVVAFAATLLLSATQSPAK
jgi:hypothetical protein